MPEQPVLCVAHDPTCSGATKSLLCGVRHSCIKVSLGFISLPTEASVLP